ncbi:hypothetical protein JRO89_XS01G0020700 [Xanthoceras sorbifolium]|uniref:Uncharacterized protein n=1 Tax=Xanthoceras sorbifolium TaxID=99658 RepID=A0ABQ8IHW0_9ROSI|nr:hypothetical protein JRO89_XS01G0020700 [Xanthoceras sorbifolium]
MDILLMIAVFLELKFKFKLSNEFTVGGRKCKHVTLKCFLVSSQLFDSDDDIGYEDLIPLRDIHEYLNDDNLIVEIEFNVISMIKVEICRA